MKKKALIISAIASNQGKTLLTMALLHHYKKRVRPFKCGPDFIDTQFHSHIAKKASINLDGYMMNKNQMKWIFNKYLDEDIAIIEGVMGYYDGMDKQASAYDVSKTLNIPTLLIIDGSGSYITLVAILQGLKNFKKSNTIKAVIINKVSSKMHYELIKKHIEKKCKDILVCGYIKKNQSSILSTHLGLDLKELEDDKITLLSQEILTNINLKQLESVMNIDITQEKKYPFKKIIKTEEHCVLVKDKNFSFIYEDNINYLKECYKQVSIIDAIKDEKIPKNADIVILPGGYVETETAYKKIKKSNNFKNSLILHSKKSKKIYAECAGLIYLGKSIDNKKMSGILPITFKLTNKRERLGYYKCKIDNKTIKGHAFHYSQVTNAPDTDIKLYKTTKNNAKAGGWRDGNIFATYLHTMWRINGLTV